MNHRRLFLSNRCFLALACHATGSGYIIRLPLSNSLALAVAVYTVSNIDTDLITANVSHQLCPCKWSAATGDKTSNNGDMTCRHLEGAKYITIRAGYYQVESQLESKINKIISFCFNRYMLLTAQFCSGIMAKLRGAFIRRRRRRLGDLHGCELLLPQLVEQRQCSLHADHRAVGSRL